MSGTAAKLGRPNAYHHCSLLVNSNKLLLSNSLVKNEVSLLNSSIVLITVLSVYVHIHRGFAYYMYVSIGLCLK